MGVSTQAFGTLCHWLIQVINLVTGNLDRVGGALCTEPAVDLVATTSGGHFNRWQSRVSGRPEYAGELPVSTLADEIRTPGKGQVRALITSAGNPVLSAPGGERLHWVGVGAGTGTLTLSGRNIGLLWSKYPGIDPETNASVANTGGGDPTAGGGPGRPDRHGGRSAAPGCGSGRGREGRGSRHPDHRR